MKNQSGIHPCGDRVLILPDDIEEVTEGGIIIPGPVGERHQMAQSIGTIIAVGPDCWINHVERDSEGRVTKTHGFTKAFAKPGDRVSFAKYGGLQVTGKDDRVYRLMNDLDVTAIVEKGVSYTDLQSRKAFHVNK